MTAKVSVIIPNFNHARFLTERIESVLGQSFKDFEIIILDDASSDESLSIIKNYINHDRVRIEINKNNSGSAFSQWRKGISMSSSEYVWIAESDDLADSSLLAKLVAILENNPQVALAYCQSHYIDGEGKIIGNAGSWTQDLDPKRWDTDFTNDGSDERKYFLSIKNTIPNASAVVFRRSAYEKIDASTSLKLCGDWQIWSRMLSYGGVGFCSKSLNYFRTHSNNIRTATRKEDLALESLVVTEEIIAQSSIKGRDNSVIGCRMFRSWQKIIVKQPLDVAIRYCIFLARMSFKLSLRLFFCWLMQFIRSNYATSTRRLHSYRQ